LLEVFTQHVRATLGATWYESYFTEVHGHCLLDRPHYLFPGFSRRRATGQIRHIRREIAFHAVGNEG